MPSQRPCKPGTGKSSNPEPRKSDVSDVRAKYLSRRQAALILGVMPVTLDKLAVVHGLTVRQIPGHDRRHFLRAEVEALAARSIVTEARA